MKECRLCNKKHNEKVGSHIITESLIRSAFNDNGKIKKSDSEVIGEISLRKIDLDFFGSNVLPERRAEILGYWQSDQEIADTSTNKFINYDLVCRACEKSFNPVETYFIQNIYSKLEKENSSVEKYFTLTHFDYAVTSLFIHINIWRASASNYSGWTLNDSSEKNIKEYLLFCLKSNDINEIVQLSLENSKNIKNHRFALAYLINSTDDPTTNAVIFDSNVQPNIIVLNKLLLIFSTNKTKDFKIRNFINWSKSDILSTISKFPDLNYPLSNTQDKKFSIKIMTNEDRIELNLGYIKHQWKNMVRHAHRTFKVGYQELTSSHPTNAHHKLLDDNIASSINRGEKASPDLLIQCCAKTIKQIIKQ